MDLRKGREAIQNDHRSGRPATITDRYNIEKVSDLLKSDRRFTCDEIERRLEIATDLLSRFTDEGNEFLSRIVAVDETWVRSYEPELKSQASEWHAPNSPRPAKFRRTQGKIKMLMIFAYDIHGILTSHRVPNGQTVNGKYYREYIQKCLRPSIRKKRPELLEARPIILHDNATPHVSAG